MNITNTQTVRKEIPSMDRPSWLLMPLERRIIAWIWEGRKVQAVHELWEASKAACADSKTDPVLWNYGLKWCTMYIYKLEFQ